MRLKTFGTMKLHGKSGRGAKILFSKSASIPSLSILIPTFNRRRAVEKTLKSLISTEANILATVTIIDNGSTDGTCDAVARIASMNANVNMIRYETNDGFQESFLRCLDAATSDYVMVLSDEDEIYPGALTQVIRGLSRESVGFVSPQMFIEQKLYRGRKQFKRITPSNCEDASFYISGLIYRTSAANEFKNLIREMASRYSVARLYPQVLLSLFMVAHYKGIWMNFPVCTKRDQLESRIPYQETVHYWEFSSRLLQFEDWLRIISELLDVTEEKKARSQLKWFRRALEWRYSELALSQIRDRGPRRELLFIISLLTRLPYLALASVRRILSGN